MNREHLVFVAAFLTIAAAAAIVNADHVPPPQGNVPTSVLEHYRNPDGSCVQCALGMTGQDQNNEAAALLLWDSPYGPKVRGGSNPSRVAKYCAERGIPIWNVTGKQTYDYMKWAMRNGRTCAIGAGTAHFQWLKEYDPTTQTWGVVNNNWPSSRPAAVRYYSDEQFRALHEASGRWIVIIDGPAAPADPEF